MGRERNGRKRADRQVERQRAEVMGKRAIWERNTETGEATRGMRRE